MEPTINRETGGGERSKKDLVWRKEGNRERTMQSVREIEREKVRPGGRGTVERGERKIILYFAKKFFIELRHLIRIWESVLGRPV